MQSVPGSESWRERGAQYLGANLGKRGIAVDLKDRAGREVATDSSYTARRDQRDVRPVRLRRRRAAAHRHCTGRNLDATASLHAVAAVLAAILHKRSTGEGPSVELAMSDVTAQLTAPQLISASLTVAVPTRSGNRTPQMLASRLSPAIRFASRDACRKSVAWGHAARFLGLMTKRVTSRAMVERIAAAR